MTDHNAGLMEVVRIQPHEGKRDALLALRGRFSREFREKTPGFISHSFHEMADGTFLDIVFWGDAASLEAVDENHPMLEEWYGMAEIVWMETGTTIHA